MIIKKFINSKFNLIKKIAYVKLIDINILYPIKFRKIICIYIFIYLS
jgi:hypothetical protein